MTPQQRESAIEYVRHCFEFNPDAGSITCTREYLADEGITATMAEIEEISFEALFGERS